MRSTGVAASVFALSIAVLAGCASNTTSQPTAEAPASKPATPVAAADGASSKATDTQPAYKVVRFPFDSSTLDEANLKIVKEHAQFLSSHPNAKILIEGHADERGTREYNMALGERRAQAVAKVLRVLGISADRVETRSYGEEKPIASAHDDTAWAQNRRGELVYGK